MDSRPPGMIAAALWVLCALLLTGCNQPAALEPQAIQTPPIGTQLQRISPDLLSGHRFLDLLSFESPTDPVFISTSSLQAQPDTSHVHAGLTSLRLSGDSGIMTVKLGSLVEAQQFPGEWTQVGAYFYSEQPAHVSVSLSIDNASTASAAVTIPPGQWTAVITDIPTTPKARSSNPALSLSFAISGSGDVWCDDVILLDNTEWIVGQPQTQSAGKWSVYRKGSNYFVSGADFKTEFPAADAQSGGFVLEEANSIRARLKGPQHVTILSDGRSYWDGKLRALSPQIRGESIWATQLASPAQLQIPETMGRIDRNSPGDENNDGFNEFRAAYMIIATGPRLEITITPQSVPVLRPLLEITGLPPGDVLVTIEGRLVERTARLKGGAVLVELPGRIDRTTTVSLRVQ